MNKYDTDKYQLYNRIVAASIMNFVNESDKNSIIIPKFYGNLTDKYFLEIAKMTSQTLATNKTVYIEMGFIKYWYFKFRNWRRMLNVKRYKRSMKEQKLPLDTLKSFMAQEFDVSISIYSEIYRAYYAEAYGD